MNLSRNFTLEEMLDSATARLRRYDEQFSPSTEVVDNLGSLCKNILQPLRDSLGVPIHVTSGYRCLRVNGTIEGSPTSQHPRGQAADIVVPGLTIDQVLSEIVRLDLPFDQLIHEFGRWIHVSYSSRNRKQILKAVKSSNRTVYLRYKTKSL